MNDKKRPDKAIVRKYLLDHPEFLAQNPQVLAELELPHESGEAVSLIERQVSQLRDSNQKLSRQLNQLVKVATDNEALMGRLHDLTLELIIIEDLGPFFDRLSEVLLDEFNADIINITLIDREVATGDKTPLFNIGRDDAELQQFQQQLEKGESFCGRLKRNKLDFLFRQRAQWVQSTALVPLGDDGMMAIGSSDPARFYPGMGTLFLDLLARVVTRRLALSEPEKKRRSA
jgi:uncharacterized protein YigA (DUF484 family)